MRTPPIASGIALLLALGVAVAAAEDGERLPDAARLAADRAKNELRTRTFAPDRDTWRARRVALAQPMPEPLPDTLVRQYRAELVLAAAPTAAGLCICTAPEFTLRINGAVAKHERGGFTMSRALYVYDDLQALLHAGRNEIVVEAGIRAWFGPVNTLVLEGMARDATGLVTHLATDASWQGRWRHPERPDGDDAWAPVVEQGSASCSDFPQPPAYGRIEIAHPGRKCPIFDDGSPIEYEVTVNAPDLAERFDLVVDAVDALADDRLVERVVLARGVAPGIQRAALRWQAPKPGVYDLRVILQGASGKALDQRVMETAVVGAIPQPEIAGASADEGLQLSLVDQVDCVDPADPHPFIARDGSGKAVASRVVDAPFGKYRVAGAPYTWLGYVVEVRHPERPHLVEVDYPDDAPRLIDVAFGANPTATHDIPNDRGERLWNKSGSGVCTGLGQPLTNTMRTLRFLCWPGARVCGVTVESESLGTAAVARIRVLEVSNELPALRHPLPAARRTGRHTERLSMLASTYYAGEDGAVFSEHMRLRPHHGFYRNWYQTNANMIRSMRFVGENLLVAGVHMYNNNFPPAEYPSPSPAYAGGNTATADPLELMARMLAKNGMAVEMGVEYGSPPELYQRGFAVSDADVAAGKPTARYVDRAGRQAPESFCTSVNIFVPEAESGLHRIIGELCDLYAKTPGILGVHIQEGESLQPSVWADYGALGGVDGAAVDDVTVGQFERDTGIAVPADRTGARRFAQRDDWLNANARERWIDWRCKRIHGINAAMAAKLRAANPAWRLSIAMLPVAARAGAEASFLEGVRVQGFDPRLYDEPNVELQFGTNPLWVRRRLDDASVWQRGRAYNRDAGILAAFTRDGRRAAARQVGGGFFEPTLNAPDRGWYWDMQLLIAYPLPPGRSVLEGYGATVVDALPSTLYQHWLDVNGAAGNEDVLREFNRVFTSLPDGDYRTLDDAAFTGDLVVRAGEAGLYVVNPLPTRVAATLTFAGAGSVVDVATGVRTPAARTVALDIDAFGVAGFALDHARPTGLHQQPLPAAAAAPYAAAVADTRPVVVNLRKRLAGGAVPSDEAPRLRRYVALAEQAEHDLAAGAVGKVRLTVDGGEWQDLAGFALDRADPQYWAVLGPFANVERSGFDRALAPETDVLKNGVANATYATDGGEGRWRRVCARTQGGDRGYVDLAATIGGATDFKLAYALAKVRCDEDLDGELLLGSDDSAAVWIDGQRVFRLVASRAAVAASDHVPVHLTRGEHVVLLKIDNGIGGWAFFADLRRRDGSRAAVEFLQPPIADEGK